jgi:GntR family transcriptional regulator
MLGCAVVPVKSRKIVAAPRYRQLAEALLADIGSGRYAVGDVLPGELELAERHRVSRHTVREALRRLQDFGLITRRRGIGTVVTADANAGAYVQRLGSPAELLRYPEPSRLEVRAASKITADAALASRLGCARGARWNVVSAVRRLQPSGAAIGWSDIYLSPRYAAVVPQVGRAGGRVFEMIERRYGARVARVEVEIRAGLVDASRAALLGVEAGSPSLTVLRRYREADGSVLQITIAEHPAERFTYAFDLHRSASGVGFEPG